ncbi:hypothetical protein ACLOJK_027618 [Asimina triloba]
MMIWVVLAGLFLSFAALFLSFLSFSIFKARKNRQRAVAFFHPYTNDGGGGERVLWCAVSAIQQENPDLDIVVYTGDDASPQSLAARALDRFGVKLLRPPQGDFSNVITRASRNRSCSWNLVAVWEELIIQPTGSLKDG